MSLQPFQDDLGHRRRTALLLFYLAAILSAIAICLVSKAPPFPTLLLALAVVAAATAVLFLLRFLRSNDEREQQVNYRALTFAFTGTLVFSLAIGFLQSVGFCLLARHPGADDHPVEPGIDSLFVAVSMKTRLRVLRAEKDWSQAELAARIGVARGTINAIETGKYHPSLPLGFKIARAFGKMVEEVFLYLEEQDRPRPQQG